MGYAAAPAGRRWPGGRLRVVDALIAFAVAAIQLGGTYGAARHQVPLQTLDPLGIALLAVGPAALLVRRRFPATVLVVVFGATLSYHVLGYPGGPIFAALLVAFFTAVATGRRPVAWSVLVAGYAGFLWLRPLLGTGPYPSAIASGALAAWLLLLATAAEGARLRRQRLAAAARSRAEEARRRAGEERLRIAGELHDVLAHHISVINVQAGVGLELMDAHPEQARTALAAIKQASKEALGELRSVLEVLRRVDEEPPRAPVPTLDRLDELVARIAATGLRVHTEVEGDRRALPAGVDRAAYRIVQEALTNVTRHAAARAATVRVAYRDDELVVDVTDDGTGSRAAPQSGGGSGIPGMRERAAALGGQLEAGPRPGAGFRVSATLPLTEGRTRR